MDLTTQQQLEAAALSMKHEREAQLARIEFPTRKTGEMNKLSKVAKSVHEILQVYDVLPEPPAIADIYAVVYSETIARLVELTQPADTQD